MALRCKYFGTHRLAVSAVSLAFEAWDLGLLLSLPELIQRDTIMGCFAELTEQLAYGALSEYRRLRNCKQTMHLSGKVH